MEQECDYRQQRSAYVELMSQSIQPNVFITLATNQTWPVERMQQSLKAFLAILDRQFLGSKWAKRQIDERTEGVFILEHVASNIHAHGLLRLPETHRDHDVDLIICRYWNRLCEGGSVNRQDLADVRRCAEYCTKEMTRSDFRREQIVCSWDFIPRTN